MPLPEPEPVTECVRADMRVALEHSQACSTYSQDTDGSYGFLYPPGGLHTCPLLVMFIKAHQSKTFRNAKRKQAFLIGV